MLSEALRSGQILLLFFLVPYYLGIVVAIFVYPRRVGLNRYAYASAFMHVPSRRNGVPWVAKTIGKIVVWPIVFGLWVQAGRPPSQVLYGPDATERLGHPDGEIPYHLRGFATKWQG